MGSNRHGATHWGAATSPKNLLWNWRDSPNVQIFIKTYKSQKWTHLYSFQEDNWAKHNWTKTLVLLLGTYWELREHNEGGNSLTMWWEHIENLMRTKKIKIQHHPTTPEKKKAWTPWMHSRLVSLATKNFYALFVLFTINGRGIIWRDMVWMARMFCCGTDDWGW